MSKNIYVIFACVAVVFLSGCASVLTGSANSLTTLAPDKPQITQTPFVLLSTSTVVPTRTLVPTLVPSPTIVPTATPFFCQYLRGQTERGSFQSTAMGEEVHYLVHLPPCYDQYEQKSFPTLYLLHGWPMTELHWDLLGVDELVDDWITRGLIGPLIVVMPGVGSDGRYVNSSGGEWSFEGMLIQELLPVIDTTYRTWRDPAGRAIGGISRGGVWSLEIGLRHLDCFSIIGAHSPALSLNQPLPQHDPFRLVEETDLSGLRMYLDAGDVDWARAATQRFRDLLLAHDVNVTYQVHTGNHIDALWETALNDYVEFYTLTWPDNFDMLPSWIENKDMGTSGSNSNP
ncbi:MAG: hypothetical protein JXA33_21555 [Anaerolineae bacterium]|nr:hypothetical protein [Anaerolineae bacterium]